MLIGEWLHHLFNPHCIECKNDDIELDRCKSCETLEQQLAQANREKHDLLNTILQLSQPKAIATEEPYKPLEDVKPKVRPWRVIQAELEANDRVTAKILADKKKEEEQANKDYTVKVPITSDTKTVKDLEDEIINFTVGEENATSHN